MSINQPAANSVATMTQRRGWYVLASALCLGVLPLTGCAPSAGFSDLSQNSTTDVEFPPLPEDALESADRSTARLVGTYGGAEIWLMKNARDGACLLTYPNEDDWTSSCSDGPAEFGLTGPAGEFVVLPDGHPSPPSQELQQISLNVYAVR